MLLTALLAYKVCLKCLFNRTRAIRNTAQHFQSFEVSSNRDFFAYSFTEMTKRTTKTQVGSTGGAQFPPRF